MSTKGQKDTRKWSPKGVLLLEHLIFDRNIHHHHPNITQQNKIKTKPYYYLRTPLISLSSEDSHGPNALTYRLIAL